MHFVLARVFLYFHERSRNKMHRHQNHVDWHRKQQRSTCLVLNSSLFISFIERYDRFPLFAFSFHFVPFARCLCKMCTYSHVFFWAAVQSNWMVSSHYYSAAVDVWHMIIFLTASNTFQGQRWNSWFIRFKLYRTVINRPKQIGRLIFFFDKKQWKELEWMEFFSVVNRKHLSFTSSFWIRSQKKKRNEVSHVWSNYRAFSYGHSFNRSDEVDESDDLVSLGASMQNITLQNWYHCWRKPFLISQPVSHHSVRISLCLYVDIVHIFFSFFFIAFFCAAVMCASLFI